MEKRDKLERLRARQMQALMEKMDKRVKQIAEKVLGFTDDGTQRMNAELDEEDDNVYDDLSSSDADVEHSKTSDVLHTGISDELDHMGMGGAAAAAAAPIGAMDQTGMQAYEDAHRKRLGDPATRA